MLIEACARKNDRDYLKVVILAQQGSGAIHTC